MQRVAIVGSGGAGKTTLAIELGRRTGLPVIHLDRLHWQPGWVETPRDVWRVVQSRALEGDQWIVDGNYGGTFEIRFERADTIIVLSPSRWRCIGRALRRSMANRGRAIQAEGCPERLDLHFLKWVWRYPVDSRPSLDAAISPYRSSREVVELRSTAQVSRFLDQAGAPSPP
jgi:adenylate kinase family enzyme